MTDIAGHIKKLADNGDEVYAMICKVLAVDANERTCDVEPLNGDADIFGVRLQSDLNASTGFMVVPVVGSNVLVSFLNKNAAYVAMCSEVDYVHLRGDGLGGLIKVADLVIKLNNIETAFTNHLNKYNSHIHSGVQTGAGSSAVPAALDTQQIEQTKRDHIENTKVNHG